MSVGISQVKYKLGHCTSTGYGNSNDGNSFVEVTRVCSVEAEGHHDRMGGLRRFQSFGGQ